MLTSKYYPAYERAAADQQVIQTLNSQAPLLFPEIQSVRGGTLTALNQGKDTKNGDFNYDRFIAEVTVTTPLSADDAYVFTTGSKARSRCPSS